MAIFKPYKIQSSQLEDLPVEEGQIIVTMDTQKIYLDKDSSNRIEIAGTEINDNLINGSATGSLRGIGTKIEDSDYTIGQYAFVEGLNSAASGNDAHAEGYSSQASNDYSHAEGYYSVASGIGSHAEGYRLHVGDDWDRGTFISKETVDNKLVLKINNWIYVTSEDPYPGCPSKVGDKVFYQNSTEQDPFGTISAIDDSNSDYSLITLSTGDTYTGTAGDYIYIPEVYTDWRPIASNYGAHAEGCSEASGYCSHAEGEGNKATNFASHAEGEMSIASGNYSHAEGYVTTASGNSSHAEGFLTTASGQTSHAEGSSTTASQQYAHAEGGYTVASNYGAHAEGSYTVASGQYSHAEGRYTKAGSNYQHVQGKYNVEDTASTYADIIGNGSSDGARSNAATVDWSGNAWYAGDVYVGSTSGTNKDAGSKKLLKEGDVITGVSVNGTSVATTGVADITSVPASILTGAIPSTVTATTQSQGDNSTKIATTAYVDTAIDNLPEPMIFKGSLGTGGTITSLPVDGSATVGDTYKVITDGTYASKAAKVGDTFICLTKTSNANTWELIPSGDEPSGTVTSVTLNATSPIAIDSNAAITTSGSRTISHATSGVTAGTYTSVTVNDTGHITAGTSPTTLAGYGITDASISSQTITLGSNSVTVPTKTSELTNDANFMSGMTILKYGSSTWQDFLTAYTAKHVVYCRASSNNNPATGSQTRMAFMAYVNDETNPTEVEFQYYRSVSSHTDSTQGDQVFVYKLNKTSGWSVTTRNAFTKVIAGTALSSSFVTGITSSITLNHATSGVTAGTYKSVTVDAQGHVTAGSNPTTISGYGITDAKIDSGVITLGSNTITPLNTSYSYSGETGSINWGYNSSDEQSSLTAEITDGTHVGGVYVMSTDAGIYNGVGGIYVTQSGAQILASNTSNTIDVTPSGVSIVGLVAPTNDNHAANKKYVDDSVSGKVSGSGTSGYLTKWNGSGSITNGPQLGSGTTTYLRNDGTWQTPTDTKNTAGSTNTSDTIYLIGAKTQAANPQTYSNSSLYFSNGLHSQATAGQGDTMVTIAQSSSGISLSYEVGLLKDYSIDIDTLGITMIGVVTPTSDTMAVNKKYVDDNFSTTDTKNTAGSTDTSSKIYLVGATSQAANPQTYSDNEVYVTSGVLTTKSVQVGGTSATMQYNSTDKCIEFVFA